MIKDRDEKKGDQLGRHDSHDLQFVRAGWGNDMEHIRGNGVVEQMVTEADPYSSRHVVKKAPLNAHDAGKDDVTNAHQDHRRE